MRTLRELELIRERQLAAAVGQVEREIAAIYRQAREQVNARMATMYEKYATDGVLSTADMTRYNRDVSLDKQLTRIIGDADAQALRKVRRLAADQYEESFFRTAWAFDNSLGARLRWGSIREADIRAAVQNPLEKIAERRLRVNSRERIRATVASGLVQGQSYPAMARGISTAINGTRYDAIRIARTEAGRAQTIGTQAGYDRAEELGIEGNQYWMATLDDRTRHSHGALDGVPMDRESGGWTFPDSGVFTVGPHQSGVAAEDILCRCALEYRVDDDAPEVRRIRDEGVVPYQTYTEWWEEHHS